MAHFDLKRFDHPASQKPGTIWLVDGRPHIAVTGLSDSDADKVWLVSLKDGTPYRYPDAFQGAQWFCGELTLRQVLDGR